jgi:hypothetical protein
VRAVVCTVALGGWYPEGAARLIQTMRQYSPAIEVQAHVNTLPFGAPANVIEDGYDYTPYCAKPFALAAAMMSGADIAILLDASFYAVRDIQPMITHIARNGYYLCKNGYKVGEWCSDRAVPRLGMTREKLMEMEECSSYAVGLNFADGRCVELLHRWCGFASDRLTFPGPHTNLLENGRNRGFVSRERGVRGHRHDQTALSVIANLMEMTNWCERPYLTAYAGYETEQTVFANQGMA